MKDSIFEVQYHPGDEIVLRFKSPEFKGLPDATRKHLLSARKEMLLALRSMLDKAIDKTEEHARSRGGKKTKIEVQ